MLYRGCRKAGGLAEGQIEGDRCRVVVLRVSLVLIAVGGCSLTASLQHKEDKNVTEGDQQEAELVQMPDLQEPT